MTPVLYEMTFAWMFQCHHGSKQCSTIKSQRASLRRIKTGFQLYFLWNNVFLISFCQLFKKRGGGEGQENHANKIKSKWIHKSFCLMWQFVFSIRFCQSYYRADDYLHQCHRVRFIFCSADPRGRFNPKHADLGFGFSFSVNPTVSSHTYFQCSLGWKIRVKNLLSQFNLSIYTIIVDCLHFPQCLWTSPENRPDKAVTLWGQFFPSFLKSSAEPTLCYVI